MGAAPQAACRCCSANDRPFSKDGLQPAPKDGSSCSLFSPSELNSAPLEVRKDPKVGLSPDDDVWGEEAIIDAPVLLPEGSCALDGTWNDRGRHHIIDGPSLTWSDGRDSTVTTTSETAFSILFKGTMVEGKLDDNFKQIQWSDGDIWYRVCLDGVWIDDGSHCNLIQGCQLKWHDNKTSVLKDLSWTSAKTSFDGTTKEGRLDETGDQLLWEQEKPWTRAGIDGIWTESKFPCRHTIKGNTLTRMSGQVDHLDVLTKNVLMLNIDGVTHEACLNQLGTELQWSDGDIWTRALSEQSNNVGQPSP